MRTATLLLLIAAPLLALAYHNDDYKKPAAVACSVAGQTRCGKHCFNLLTSDKHCGKCNKSCPHNKKCVAGSCKKVPKCHYGQTLCGLVCANLRNDNAHCGTCTTACGANSHCTNKACACNTGYTSCAGACRAASFFTTNKDHCGNCGTSCAAGEKCKAGECVEDNSNPGSGCTLPQHTFCAGECRPPGYFQHTDAHCGNCATACTGTKTCKSGNCS